MTFALDTEFAAALAPNAEAMAESRPPPVGDVKTRRDLRGHHSEHCTKRYLSNPLKVDPDGARGRNGAKMTFWVVCRA